MTISFMRMPLLVQEVVSKHVDWDELCLPYLVLELMKSKKLKYCLALSKTRISVDSIKFTLSSKISVIKMEKGNQKLTFRIRRISCSQRENHNHSWQPWCPKLQNVLNLNKEEEEIEMIGKIMDYLDPVLVFKKTSVTIEESEFVEPFFSWNKVKKFEELTISKEPFWDPTTGEILAINVTLGIVLKIQEELEVHNLKLCVHVVDHPGFQFEYQSSRISMSIFGKEELSIPKNQN